MPKQVKRKPGRPKTKPAEDITMAWIPQKLTKREREIAGHEAELGSKDREIALLRSRVKDLEEGMARLDEQITEVMTERDAAHHLLAIIRATVGGPSS